MVDFKDLNWVKLLRTQLYVGGYVIDVHASPGHEEFWLYLETRENFKDDPDSSNRSLRIASEVDLFTAMSVFYGWQKEIEATLSDPSAPYEIAREEYL